MSIVTTTTPFSITFTTPEEVSITVSLVNSDDLLKIARIYELFLLEHDIPFTSTERFGKESYGRERNYVLKKLPGKNEIKKEEINAVIDHLKKNMTLEEIEDLLKPTETPEINETFLI